MVTVGNLSCVKNAPRMRKPKVLDPSEFSLPTREHQFFCLEKDFTLCFHRRSFLESEEHSFSLVSWTQPPEPLGNWGTTPRKPASLWAVFSPFPQSTQMFLETRLVIRQPAGKKGLGRWPVCREHPKARVLSRWSSRAPERGACCHSEAVLCA